MPKSKLQVLLVEDHYDSAVCLARLLEMQGYDVVVAGTGHEAIDNAQATHFDLALCDVALPDIDGCDLLAQLLAVQPMKAIAVTGNDAVADIARCLAAGFAGHLLKPFGFEDILSAIRNAVPELVPG